MDIKVTNEDLIAIKTASEEARLNSEIRALQTSRAALGTSSNEVHVSITEAVTAFPFPPELSSISNSLAASLFDFYGVKFPVTAENVLCESDGTIRVTASVHPVARINGVGSHEKSVNQPLPPSITDLLKKRDHIASSIASVENDIKTRRRALANLPALGRQVRASLATALLSSTEAGGRILSAIKGTVASDTPSPD